MQYKNLSIIGTSHIAKQSMEEVTHKIEALLPDIVAIELDKNRFEALLSESKHKPTWRDIKRYGIKGFIFASIGAWAEKRLGEQVGSAPGGEMKRAVELARKHGLKIALIDEDIEKILHKISSSMKWREKFNFLVDIFKSLFTKQKLEFDLRKVPEEEIISKLLRQVKKRYPSLYKVLITDRNKLMASRLSYLMEKNPDKKILAIVGAGHVEGIIKMLKSS